MLLVAMGLSLLVFSWEHLVYWRMRHCKPSSCVEQSLLGISRGIYSCFRGVQSPSRGPACPDPDVTGTPVPANVLRVLQTARDLVSSSGVGGSLETASHALRTWRQRSASLQAAFSVQGAQQPTQTISSPQCGVISKPVTTVNHVSSGPLLSPALRSSHGACFPPEEIDPTSTTTHTFLCQENVPQMSLISQDGNIQETKLGISSGPRDISHLTISKRLEPMHRPPTTSTVASPHCRAWCPSPIPRRVSRRPYLLCDSVQREDWRLHQRCGGPFYCSLPHTSHVCPFCSNSNSYPVRHRGGKWCNPASYKSSQHEACLQETISTHAVPPTLTNRDTHTVFSMANLGRTVCYSQKGNNRNPSSSSLGTFPGGRARSHHPVEAWRRISWESEV